MKSKRINFRFALVLIASLAVLGVATHFLHAYQVRRTANAMQSRARQLESEGQIAQAVDYLGRYLSLNPDKNDELAHYGSLLADQKMATTPRGKARALAVLNRVLSREPDRLDIRRKAVRLSMDLGQFKDAEKDLTLLIGDPPTDAELQYLRGQCNFALGQYKAARLDYEAAKRLAPHGLDQLDPDPFGAYRRLATLLRTKPSELLTEKEKTRDQVVKSADLVMNDLVDANDKSAKAHLLRAKYRRQYGVGDASEDVRAAAKLAPDDADVYLTAATIALGQQHIDEARETLRRGYEHLPNESQLHLAAAQLELQYGMIDAAVARLEAGLEKLPRQRDLLWEKALVLTLADRKAEAENAIQQLQKDNFPKPFLDCLGARGDA